MEEAIRDELLRTLKDRFEKNMNRHPNVTWEAVLTRLEAYPGKLQTLYEMERTGGEPDVVKVDAATGEIIFYDCSPESPAGRRSLCYDRQARVARKKHPPSGSAMELAEEIGIELLTEEQYRELQQFGPFDLKTSSWVKTPDNIRQLGGALFCDRRYNHVFVYHNGADSYYASRGFRGLLKV